MLTYSPASNKMQILTCQTPLYLCLFTPFFIITGLFAALGATRLTRLACLRIVLQVTFCITILSTQDDNSPMG